MTKTGLNLSRCLGLLVLLCLGCSPLADDETSGAQIVLIGLDGANWGIIDQLREQNKLPHIDSLVTRGARGFLRSIQTRRLLRWDQDGIWSPVVWTTIATGKVPSKHGIEDFVLPKKGSTRRWLNGDPATVKLPGFATEALVVSLRVRAFEGCPQQRLSVTWNGVAVGTQELDSSWRDLAITIPPDIIQPKVNALGLNPSLKASPREVTGQSEGDPRMLAVCVAELTIGSTPETTLFELDLIRDRHRFGTGWHAVEVERETAASYHRTCSAIWNILSDLKRTVGVIGFWASWPAEPVNGFVVTSNVGLRGWLSFDTVSEEELASLAYPASVMNEIREVAPTKSEVDAQFAKRFYDFETCQATSPKEVDVFRSIVWQDELYSRILDHKLEQGVPDLLAVYFEGIDIASHHYWRFMDHAAEAERTRGAGCEPETLRSVIYHEYERADELVGRILAKVDRDATIILVSDHGFAASGLSGGHHLYGVLLMTGPIIRSGVTIDGAGVEDIIPTILYLMRYPIGSDMDGKVIYSAIKPDYLMSHPLHFIETYDRNERQVAAQPLSGIEDEYIDRLEGIGYLQ